MPVHVLASNRSERLVEGLASLLSTPSRDAFAPAAVVVHGRGLERWLQHELAWRMGICANVVFPFPDFVMGQVRAAALGVDERAWSRQRVVATLLEVLDGASEPVRSWLADAPGDRRRVELAHTLAAQFDRYATYRPELAADWAGSDTGGWQGDLWRAVRDRLGPDPATTDAALERRLTGEVDLGSLPRRLAFFSVGTLPPPAIRLLGSLGRHLELHLFVLAPSRSTWDAVHAAASAWRHQKRMPSPAAVGAPANHPLLASCGGLARDFQVALERIEAPVTVETTFAEPGDDSVLHALQSDLHHDRTVRRALAPSDTSVRIHACAGPARQVEVLRDELLYLLDTVPELEPRDVVVMTPDIERWSPLVRSTFGDGTDDWHRRSEHSGSLPRIPFRIADRGARSENVVAGALLRILGMARSRLPASEVLELAAVPPIQRRFGFDSAGLAVVREWLAESGIRWGRDAAHRVAEDLPADDGYTWRFGLDRLVLGQAMSGDGLVLGRSPSCAVEDKDRRALLGAWIDFAETLISELGDLERPRSPLAWRDRLMALLDRCVDPAERWQSHRVRSVLAELPELGERSLDRDGVLAWLERRFDRPDPGSGFLAGGVTFCQLVPMRSIPFRVVVLLGMDDGAFPRLGAGLASDLVAAEPRTGDRSARDDDRALFLESLLSARDHLVVLYTGLDPQDGRARPPCVPVAELLDVLDAALSTADGRRAREHLVSRHPLVPWSTRYLEGGPLFTHDSRQVRSASALAAAPAPRPAFMPAPLDPVPLPADLTLEQLQSFFKAPIKAICRSRLNLSLAEDEGQVHDREPFVLPRGLETWALTETLLEAALRGEDLVEGGGSWQLALASGRLPLGMPGEEALRGVISEVRAILADAVEDLGHRERRETIEVDLGLTRLSGTIPFREGRAVLLSASRARGGRRFSAWLGHLLCNAGRGDVETRFFGARGDRVRFAPIDAGAARGHLADLVALYSDGHRRPLLWFPDAAWDFVNLRSNAVDPDEALRERCGRVARGWGRWDWGEPDGYARLVLGHRCPFDPDEAFPDVPIAPGGRAWELAESLWAPASTSMEGG